MYFAGNPLEREQLTILSSVLPMCPKLRQIDIGSAGALDPEQVKRTKQQCPSLTIMERL